MHASVQDDTIAPTELRGFSIPSTAERLGVSRSHIWSLVRSRKISTLRLGRRRIIPATEIARLLSEAV